MLRVLARYSDGSVQWVAHTLVPLHCARAWVSLVTPFASPTQGSWGTSPGSHHTTQAGRYTLLLPVLCK